MPAHGHATTWKLPLGIGRARDVRGWYHELKEWWEAHKAARREARFAALTARWDAKREAVRSPHADAALDMRPRLVDARGGPLRAGEVKYPTLIGADAGSMTMDFHFPIQTFQAEHCDLKYNPNGSRFQERPIQVHLHRITTHN